VSKTELNAPFQNRPLRRMEADQYKTAAAVLFAPSGLSTERRLPSEMSFPKSSDDKIKQNWAAYLLEQLSSRSEVSSGHNIAEELSEIKAEFYDLRSIMESVRQEFVRFSETISKLNTILDDRLLYQEQELQRLGRNCNKSKPQCHMKK